MITAEQFLDEAKRRGVDFFTGVPCSFLTPLINRVISDDEAAYVGAASEGEAVAIAAGAWLTGKTTMVMCQNSGLGNTVNPLTSLNWPFRIPTLMIVTWRGQPGLKDEPQHELMGQITGQLLDDMQIPHAPFPTDVADIGGSLDTALKYMSETGLSYALIMEKGSVADEELNETPRPLPTPAAPRHIRKNGERPERMQALEALLKTIPDEAPVIATTGKAGRELFTLADREQHLYQVGSMGGASAMGLGVALNTTRPVIVVDGDGAALMKMGNLATVGAQGPENLVHVLLDNGVHDSTGGQSTVSASVDFAAVASACGYVSATSTDTIAAFTETLESALKSPGPHMIHVAIRPGSIDDLARPTVKPDDVARRLRRFLGGE
ncbi:MAG: phosphonopyruvate decarboxylase [Rhodospirillaceae bacterium]|jgi:phosphonopyruvate decarboxylase|nr:phosphonopyruvate decarboxylase [Rhodospirillaceae bacterium]MBT4220330.1 phosphonopyruvate decarboxylase [Rhodospirillaceae bacterium]MBT5013490.1 phosphonopyruvate decarboxylase [Rhodospirillaceae bacterium]MBT5308976.1 phosphonopyruvate decarboxylase [Rhodospirillaceae bacterium]MBT6407505.1 phosphonopyruvate decarboxylase [Rhodospirillaceae bacterium]